MDHIHRVEVSRRRFLAGLSAGVAATVVLGACADEEGGTGATASAGWVMPAEDAPHERTWMCWPSSAEVWGEDLVGVQDAIVAIASTIARFEAVTMLARPGEVDALRVGCASTAGATSRSTMAMPSWPPPSPRSSTSS